MGIFSIFAWLLRSTRCYRIKKKDKKGDFESWSDIIKPFAAIYNHLHEETMYVFLCSVSCKQLSSLFSSASIIVNSSFK